MLSKQSKSYTPPKIFRLSMKLGSTILHNHIVSITSRPSLLQDDDDDDDDDYRTIDLDQLFWR